MSPPSLRLGPLSLIRIQISPPNQGLTLTVITTLLGLSRDKQVKYLGFHKE